MLPVLAPALLDYVVANLQGVLPDKAALSKVRSVPGIGLLTGATLLPVSQRLEQHGSNAVVAFFGMDLRSSEPGEHVDGCCVLIALEPSSALMMHLTRLKEQQTAVASRYALAQAMRLRIYSVLIATAGQGMTPGEPNYWAQSLDEASSW